MNPRPSAWQADVLPLNYARSSYSPKLTEWDFSVKKQGKGYLHNLSRKQFHFRDIAKVSQLHNSLRESPSPSEANGGGWGGLQRGRTGARNSWSHSSASSITEKKMFPGWVPFSLLNQSIDQGDYPDRFIL